MLLLLQKSISGSGSGSKTGAILFHQQRPRNVARSQRILPEQACRSTRPRSARMMSHPRRYLRVIRNMLKRKRISKRRAILHNSLNRTDPYTHSSWLDSSFAMAASVAQPACVLRIIRVCSCRCLRIIRCLRVVRERDRTRTRERTPNDQTII